jgi:hypothetical protein
VPDTNLPPDPDILRISPELMAQTAAVMAGLAPWAMPLLSACREGLLAICAVPRGEIAPRRLLESRRRPLCVWVQDDDHETTGPSGFPSAKWLCTRWARMAIVHGAAGEREHYIGAVLATVVHHRILLIETSSAFADAWCDLLGNGHRIPVLKIIPHDGRQHPAPHAARDLQ